MLNDFQRDLIARARKILVIQAENPDGDSLGSALALEEILGEMPAEFSEFGEKNSKNSNENFAEKSENNFENLRENSENPKNDSDKNFANLEKNSRKNLENRAKNPAKNSEKKQIFLHCPVQIPTYLRHVSGWDRVSPDFPTDCDLAIIVDTSSKILLSKTLKNPPAKNWLENHPVLVFDHHVSVEPDLPFDCDYIISDTAVATGELIFDICAAEKWKINARAATNLFISIQADSLGLTTQATTAQSFFACGKLVEFGANPAEIENARREFMKKKPEILKYKGELISRIEYFNEGRTALIFVPFSEIQEYSNDYNPTMLVLDEMRLVVGVDVAIGVKTYPDGKLTGKLRTNIPISHLVAKSFGGDGHPFAAGFRIYESYDEFVPELVKTLDEIYKEFDNENAESSQKIDNSAQNFDNKIETNFAKKQKKSDKNLGNFRIKKG